MKTLCENCVMSVRHFYRSDPESLTPSERQKTANHGTGYKKIRCMKLKEWIIHPADLEQCDMFKERTDER